jgi:hypothetical protein
MRKIMAIALLTILLLGHAVQGAETRILNLSCEGRVTNLLRNRDNSDNPPEPVTKMGLVVNFDEHTVTGFAFPARIDNMDDARVEFRGKNGNWAVWGSVDRTTGGVSAITMALHPTKPEQFTESKDWDLFCKPTKRKVQR